MGENSEPKPKSDVILRKSLTIGLKKSGFEKSLSLGLKICRLKKVSISVSKVLVSKKSQSLWAKTLFQPI